MNKELLNAAKDQAARELTFPDFDYVKKLSLGGKVSIETLDVIYTRAMEIYAEGVAVEFAERLRRNYTNHLTGGGGWRYYGDKKQKVITTQELFNRFNTKP